jgi:hypothetical protein
MSKDRDTRAVAWILTLAVATCGCAELIDVAEDPELVADEPWYCLGRELDSLLPAREAATIRVRPCDALDESCTGELSGLEARLCAKGDIGCTQPLSRSMGAVDGVLVFDAPTGQTGFDGYLSVTSPDASCTSTRAFGAAAPGLCSIAPDCKLATLGDCIVPTYPQALLFFNPPVIEDFEVPLNLWLSSTPLLIDIIAAAGSAAERGNGSVIATTLDCTGALAAGVHYELIGGRDDVTPFYVKAGSVSGRGSRTDTSGVGGFVAVAPGAAEIVAYNQAWQRVGSAQLQVAPFGQTFVTLVPTVPFD